MDKLARIKNAGRKFSPLWLLACLLITLPVTASPLLYEVRYNPLLNGETEIEFIFDEPLANTPEVTLLNSPARLSVSFAAAELEPRLANVAIDSAGITQIRSMLTEQGVTSVIGMESLKVYRTRMSENIFAIHLADTPQVTRPGTVSEINPSFINQLQAIDFRRGDKGDGRVLVFLKESSAAIDVQERLGKLEIEFHNTSIPDELLYELDVLDFATVVKTIETFREGSSTRLVIDATEQFTYSYQQVDNIFTLTMQKEAVNRGLGAKKEYQGQPISLNFQDIPIRTVLQIIADHNGFNLVTSDSVSGNVTLRLDGIPWDQALDIVLRVKGLDRRMEGNILMVAPTEELASREARELEARQQVEQLEPLFSDFLQINYAKAADLAGLLSNKEATLLSARGSVVVDERTNTILIKDTARIIENVRSLIQRLDIPVRQVLIESRIVTVNDNVTDELGIRWGLSDQQSSSGGNRGVSGNSSGANSISTGNLPTLDDRWNVNLPVSNPAGSIAFHVARLADGTLLDLELSALEQENKGEVIASPRITTSNQKEARIEQGVEIPYVQAASSGATTVEFKKAVLSLTVTPQITPDNKIILDLVITQNTRGETVQTPTGPATAIDTQQIMTQVLADNGETIVLGGIYQQQIVSTVSKVPLLGDIPYLGVMFRNKRELNEKSELLIFVTPRILTEGQ
ncbi:type IV pilus secretin PilQ [Alishewanella sp. d11]|uniref:type IV pilus secretin PilQ n=1 Tax=Alishewanella sp. d11 TaxID=3414030 RepID=UPI003BF7A61B